MLLGTHSNCRNSQLRLMFLDLGIVLPQKGRRRGFLSQQGTMGMWRAGEHRCAAAVTKLCFFLTSLSPNQLCGAAWGMLWGWSSSVIPGRPETSSCGKSLTFWLAWSLPCDGLGGPLTPWAGVGSRGRSRLGGRRSPCCHRTPVQSMGCVLNPWLRNGPAEDHNSPSAPWNCSGHGPDSSCFKLFNKKLFNAWCIPLIYSTNIYWVFTALHKPCSALEIQGEIRHIPWEPCV